MAVPRERPDIHDTALRLLAFRARTAAEMERALMRREFEPGEVRGEIARLREAGLLDDATVSRGYAASRLQTSPRAPGVVQLELRRRGVTNATAATAVAIAASETTELELARRAAASRVRAVTVEQRADPDTVSRLGRRLAGFLMRRGFAHRVIAQVLQENELNARSRVATRRR